ncbi:TetR family transcriptional regulator [Nocardia sp. SYP-A9097]|uniref:TetR/AcrR family transcriptional regulator n=1 Tax=Nocardia sp. SYP-A9097 TaxID=2663237 RepID=UPI00129ADBA8|nr:TetR family transcriptional regulator [Nocardia sp. SYP-A9097]MRH88769.1 TetR family transcriptional regulator [Nocardia sp. SYP-A9097]
MSESSMHADLLERHRPGLRERKKQQTRTRIIDVALRLCDAQGFDATTVEQIADAADVSPRTINRYFDSKEAIVIAPIEEVGIALAEQLRAQPITGNELQALLNGFTAFVEQVIESDHPVPFRWFQQMQRITQSSPTVRAQSLQTADGKTRAMTTVLAERLRTDPNSMQVQVIATTWHAIARIGMECDFDGNSTLPDCSTPVSGRDLIKNVEAAFEEFTRSCALPVATAVAPPR